MSNISGRKVELRKEITKQVEQYNKLQQDIGNLKALMIKNQGALEELLKLEPDIEK